MASTIKLKNSTTIGNTPSSLETGEVAINVADGNLFYGSASAVLQNFVVDELQVKGNLTAQQYIVSSSVVYTTQSFSSGSTAFGDSADDTHVFTGNITASGNISASGNVLGIRGEFSQIQVDGEVALNTSDSATTGQVFADSQITKIKIGKAGSITSTLLESNVTASGNISASGTITAATLDAASVSDALAAAIVAEIDNDEIPIAKLAEDAVTVTAGTNLGGGGSVTLGGSITLNVDDAFIKNDADDATTGILTAAGLKSTTHITSSGNISASGNIIGDTLTVNAITFPQDTNITIQTPDESESNGNGGNLTIEAGNGNGSNGNGGDLTFNSGKSSGGGDAGDIIFNTFGATSGGTSGSLIVNSKNFFVSTDGHITASGNISASGTITAATLDAAAVSDTLAAAIVAEIDNDEIPIAKLAEDSISGVTLGGNLNNLTVDDATLQLNSGTTFNGSAARTISIKDGGVDSDALAANVAVTQLTSSIISASGDIFCTNITVAGDIASVGDDVIIGDDLVLSSPAAKLRFSGSAGGGNEAIQYYDSNGDVRNVIMFTGTNVFSIMNRAPNGTVEIRANTSTGGTGGEVTVANFEDDKITHNVKSEIRLEKTSNTDADYNGDVVFFGGTTSMDAGKIYYFNSSGNWALTDADAEATADGLLAVALGAASDTNGMLIKGMVTLDHDPGTIGDPLFLSTTAGQASSTAPSATNDIVRLIGYCLDSTNGQIYFNPSNDFIKHA